MQSYGTLIAIGISAAVVACAGLETAERSDVKVSAPSAERMAGTQPTERTAVSQAATGAIVGCASNAAIQEPNQPQRRPLSPLCLRKS